MIVRLFPVELQGKNSAEVESLASYLYRLAFEHGMHVGEFIGFVYRNTIHQLGYPEDFPKLPQTIRASELCRPNKTTQMLTRLFDIVTGESLKSSTLWFMNGNLGRSAGEIYDSFRWCPECFGEMDLLNQTPYIKLIWHMKATTHCSIHRTPLLDECPECGRKQTSYVSNFPFGQCRKCGAKLSNRNTKLSELDIAKSWQISGSDIAELFKDLTTLKQLELPCNGVQKSLEHIFDYYWSRNKEEEFYQLLSRDELLSIIHKQKHISLKTARRLAYRMGISLYTLMSGNAHNSTAVLNFEWLCELPAAYEGTTNKNKRDHQAIIKKLEEVLLNREYSPSLKEIAKKLKVSVGYLEYRFPTIVNCIVKDHRDFVEQQKLQQLYYAQSYALAFFVNERYENYTKSKREGYRFLRKRTSLPRELLKFSIRKAYSAVYSR